jgi:hypothetical protein
MIDKEEIKKIINNMIEIMKEIDCENACQTFYYDLKEHPHLNLEISITLKNKEKNE